MKRLWDRLIGTVDLYLDLRRGAIFGHCYRRRKAARLAGRYLWRGSVLLPPKERQ